MSAFLGPIHTWLYNKIIFQDNLADYIARSAQQAGITQNFTKEMDEKFGALEKGELADICDENNIHGWLAKRVELVERRLAYIVTQLTKNEEMIEKVYEWSYKFGKENAIEAEAGVSEAFKKLEATLLNGMPCDRVNEVIAESEKEIVWRENVDIHSKYWQEVNGQVADFYAVRQAVIKGIISKTALAYESSADSIYRLKTR